MEDNILDADFREEKYQSVKYAGFWTRVLASLVDVIVIIPIIVLVLLNIIYLKSLIVDFLLATLMLSYKPFLEFKYGATLGKMALKIKVVTEQFEDIDLQTSIIRNFIGLAPGILGMYHSFLLFNHESFHAVDSFVTYGLLTDEIPDPISRSLNFLMLVVVIFVAFTKKKQGLHDMLAKTVCVHKEK